MKIDPEELIPSDDVAKLLCVKPATLVMWRHDGRGPAYVKIGRQCFYRREDVQTWLALQRREPTVTQSQAA